MFRGHGVTTEDTERYDEVLQPPIEPMLAKLVDEIPDTPRPVVRAEVGRLSIDRVPRHGRPVHSEPRSEAARSLLPRAARRAARAPASRLRPRRRNRDRHEARDWISTRCNSGCIPRPHASRSSRRHAPRLSSPSICSRSTASRSSRCRNASGASGSKRLLKTAAPPLYLTPMTRDRKTAAEWLQRFEGAGLDGVIAKPEDAAYQPGKRAMFKIKHARTADCVVAGFRWHKNGEGIIGSLLLGLFDDKGALHHVGVTSSFTMAKRKELVEELEPLRKNAARHASAGRPGRRGPPSPRLRRPGMVANGCRAARAVGVPARICPGSRCASNASAK